MVMRGLRAVQEVGLEHEVGVSNASLDRWRATERALGGRVLSDPGANRGSASRTGLAGPASD